MLDPHHKHITEKELLEQMEKPNAKKAQEIQTKMYECVFCKRLGLKVLSRD